MNEDFVRKRDLHLHNRGTADELHRAIYYALAGFAAGWILITFTFFLPKGASGHAYGGMIGLIVAAFAVMVVAIPSGIRRISLNHPVGRNVEPTSHSSLHDWLEGELGIWDGHIKGLDAAIAILLPGIAAMVGGIALAIVFNSVTP